MCTNVQLLALAPESISIPIAAPITVPNCETLHRSWKSLHVSARELRCDVTLVNGQCFGWKPLASLDVASASSTSAASAAGEYIGVIGWHVVALKQTDNDTLYSEEYPGDTDSTVMDGIVRKYFGLDQPVTLHEHYTQWCHDARFAQIASHFPGVRLLRQEPVECLFSFICSSNNHISRITKMLSSLRAAYGESLCTLAGQHFYAFPTVDRLAQVKENELRNLGFGYRARFVTETARLLQTNGGASWLNALRSKSRQDVQRALMTLQGVGRKVADCVALFSLDKLDCVPVDTHVWQIAVRDYKAQFKGLKKNKAMNKAAYEEVGNFFRSIFGEYAGWAHSVLFTADLAAFRDRLLRGQGANGDKESWHDLPVSRPTENSRDAKSMEDNTNDTRIDAKDKPMEIARPAVRAAGACVTDKSASAARTCQRKRSRKLKDNEQRQHQLKRARVL